MIAAVYQRSPQQFAMIEKRDTRRWEVTYVVGNNDPGTVAVYESYMEAIVRVRQWLAAMAGVP